MYVRNLRKPSATKNVYKFASSKNRGVILCESSLERDCCYHLEYSKDVISFQSQPEGFYYSSGNKRCLYTPGFQKANGELKAIPFKERVQAYKTLAASKEYHFIKFADFMELDDFFNP